jgi:hypothetical protein
MQLCALVSEEARQRICEDPWLSLFDWTFLCDVASAYSHAPDLLVLEACAMTDMPAGGGLPAPCWCFGADGFDPDVSGDIEFFGASLDAAVLGDRLAALLWLHGKLVPACFAGVPLALTNGRLSFQTVSRLRYLLQMTVTPTAEVGGDVALYFESDSRTLVVLGDAIGHGEDAALDAAQFALGVVRHVFPSGLSCNSLQALHEALLRRLARGRFVAASFIEFDRLAGTVRLLNAGMPDIALLRPDSAPERFPSTQPPFGVPGALPGDILTRVLTAGCRWALHSDGADGGALLDSLAAVDCHRPDGRPCIDTCRLGGCTSVHRSPEVADDASQIIVCIADS